MRPITMIPTDQIQVLNPRSRNRAHHREIIDNIARIGLKRPITVSRLSTGGVAEAYALVCGQGRLEAFRQLGLPEIPAVIVDADEAECMVMSLVENIARRHHPAIESMREIGSLHAKGYKDHEIATKIGATASWVGMILILLEKGEERLVAAVETGLIPISLAIDIARSDDAATQQLLMDAYTDGTLRGRKLGVVRRLLQRRARGGKAQKPGAPGPHIRGRALKVEQLKRVYQREVEKQQLLVKKADVTQARLLFLVRALRDLRSDKQFAGLLRSEDMETLPRVLAERMQGQPS